MGIKFYKGIVSPEGWGSYIRVVLKIRIRISDLVYYLALNFLGLISEPSLLKGYGYYAYEVVTPYL